MKTKFTHLLMAALLGVALTTTLYAQTSAFTYQGQMTDNGSPASGVYHLRFAIYDAATNGVEVSVLTNAATVVTDGLFTVTLDFGSGVFDGGDRWLEIGAVTNGGGGFTTLSPRQNILSTPLAIHAQQADTVPAGAITGEMIAAGAVSAPKIVMGAVSQLGTPNGTDPDALLISNQGFVGLGTSNPQAALHISGGRPVPEIKLLFSITNGTGSFTNIVGTESLAYSDDVLAIASRSSSAVTLMDVSDPSAPVVASQLRDGVDGFDFLSRVRRVSLSSNLLVISAQGESAVTLVDVSDPYNPEKLTELIDGQGGWTNLNGALGTSISGNLLAITAQGDAAVTLADISNPASPVILSEMINGQDGFDQMDNPVVALISGTNLYIGSFFAKTVTIVDIQDPSNPVPLAVYPAHTEVDGLAVSDNVLAFGAADVTLLDVSQPDVPLELAILDDNTKTPVFFHGFLTLPPANLYDLTVPTAPLAFVTFEGPEGGFVLAASDSHIFSAGSQSLAVFSIGNGDSEGEISLVTSGRVGIGTDTPHANLHVVGDAIIQGQAEIAGPLSVIGDAVLDGDATIMGSLNASSTLFGNRIHATFQGFTSSPSFSFEQDSNTGMYRPGSDTLGFATGGSERLRINSSGRVGIGTFSPATTLDVNGTISGNGSGLSDLNATELTSGTVPSARISGTYSSTLTLSSSANSISGSFNGNTSDTAGAPAYSWSGDSDTGMFQPTANTIGFSTAGSEQMRITSSGDVGIGTTAPETELHVTRGSAGAVSASSAALLALESDDNAFVHCLTPTDGYSGILFGSPVDSFDASIRYNFFGNRELIFRPGGNSTRMVILANGNVGIGNNSPGARLTVVNATCNGSSWINASDRNLKQDFSAVDPLDVLERVAALPVQSWSYRAQPGQKHLGPVAQDFHAAFGLGGNDTTIATVDADGVALAAIQGLNEKVEVRMQNAEVRNRQLEERLEQKETEITELRARLERLEQLVSPLRTTNHRL